MYLNLETSCVTSLPFCFRAAKGQRFMAFFGGRAASRARQTLGPAWDKTGQSCKLGFRMDINSHQQRTFSVGLWCFVTAPK